MINFLDIAGLLIHSNEYKLVIELLIHSNVYLKKNICI